MDLMAKISNKLKSHGMGDSGHLIKRKKKKKPLQSIATTEAKEIDAIKKRIRAKWYENYRANI